MKPPAWTIPAGLYLLSLAIETATAFVRLVAFGLPLWLLAKLAGTTVIALPASLLLAYLSIGPLALSLLAVAGLPGGALERFALGARQPSQRERDAFSDALAQLSDTIRAPRRWYVIDSPDLNACVIGDVLYLNRALTLDAHLAAVVAHELAHLGLDGRLTLALRRFCLPIGRDPGILAGGLSCRILEPAWLAWWRHREYRADDHATQWGHGELLAELLERTQLLDAAAPFMRERTHPYSELRIERLRRDHAISPAQTEVVK
jgi:Zn-dependent protease with chaperone function